MPPSQLKRLKASLREQGITGPPKSKRQKKQGLSTEAKIKRNAALASIRETLNPFEVKHLSRPAKNDITTAKTLNGKPSRVALGRPGVTRSLGEERRRQTLLVDVQNRNKVGGIVDNRIGEEDPFLTFEERALQRFASEKSKKGSVFDLEALEEEDLLTHGGKTLDFDGEDYDAGSLDAASEDNEPRGRKRRHEELDDDANVEEEGAEEWEEPRNKSKAEVMEEVIKKSKLFKFERQKAREEDDETRRALDRDLSDIRDALGAFQKAIEKRSGQSEIEKVVTLMHPDRADLINGTNGTQSKDIYDSQLKKLANDQRAKPTDRTKTEEEKAEEEAERLKDLEESRIKRMLGIEDVDEGENPTSVHEGFFPEEDDAVEFGFQQRQNIRHTRPDGIDDEDDFLIEDGLVASSGSEVGDAEISDIESEKSLEDELLALEESNTSMNGAPLNGHLSSSCPRSLNEISALFADIPYERYHEKIRQIRLSNDPLQSGKKRENSMEFLKTLIAFLPILVGKTPAPPSKTLDVVIRHIHSMARKFADIASQSFRDYLQTMHETGSMSPGDLVMLTAIGTVFPPSDHFHAVVTPAMLLMAKWLAFSATSEDFIKSSELAKGAYLVRLLLKYQERSKRYTPEAVRYTLAVLSSKARISPSILQAHISNLDVMTDLWSSSPAFTAIFPPSTIDLLRSVQADQKVITRVTARINTAESSRRMLLLHNHRPVAIRTFVPRFEEEGFDKSKRYDPDPARAESARLRKEYKRERKSTLRELRKDSRFLAREKLKEKVEKDRRYEEKYRKLVSEIQNEEGREAKAYEKEKKKRRGK